MTHCVFPVTVMIHIREHLLHYMENTTYENAVNEDLREIHRMVETVKKDPEVGGMRIQILEENYELKREVTRQADKITEQADEIIKQSDEIEKLKDEIKSLREELYQRKSIEKG